MKTLSSFNFKNKTVLLRADLNSDVIGKKVVESERIKESAKTISALKKKKAKIVVLAHQGKPGQSDFVSLKQHSKLLNKYTKVVFVPDILGKKAETAIKTLMPGEAILLDNIRKEASEFEPDKKGNKLLKFFKNKADIYVNDAFSVCHRKQTSIVSFPKYFPSSMGLLLEKEIKALKKVKMKNCLFILGGAKLEDNSKLLRNKNKILTCGIFGQACLIVKGKHLGKNNDKINKKMIKDYSKNLRELKKILKKREVETPIDFAVMVGGNRKELNLEEFPTNYVIYDLGKQTIKKYLKEIKKANSVFMKGPAGYCGYKGFCKGTKKILNAIAKNKGFSLIAGGHLNDAIKKTKTNKNRFEHISLSGGALLRYIAGEKLPGLKALKKIKKKRNKDGIH